MDRQRPSPIITNVEEVTGPIWDQELEPEGSSPWSYDAAALEEWLNEISPYTPPVNDWGVVIQEEPADPYPETDSQSGSPTLVNAIH